MSASANITSLVSKSIFVSLMKLCKNAIGPYCLTPNEKKGKTISTTRVSDMVTIEKLFNSDMPFTSMNRQVDENWLWESHNSCKLPNKKDKVDSLTCHQQKVADVFNILSTSLPYAMPDDHQNDTIELDSNESLPSSSEKTSTIDIDEIHEDDEDPEDALRTYSV